MFNRKPVTAGVETVSAVRIMRSWSTDFLFHQSYSTTSWFFVAMAMYPDVQAKVQKELDKYQAVYGNASSVPPESAQLSEQLQRKQDELDKLRLQDKERKQARLSYNIYCPA